MVIVDISSVRDIIGATQPISLTIGLQEIEETDSWVHGTITLCGQIANVGKLLRLSCEVSSQATLECSRCLIRYEQPVKFDFTVELESDSAQLQTDEVDIAPYIREELIFQEPMKPLCHEDCRGICPRCGVNLNQTDCACDRTILDPRLAVLRRLLEF